MLCKARNHCRASKQHTDQIQFRIDVSFFSSSAIDISAGLSCYCVAAGLYLPSIRAHQFQEVTLLQRKSCRLHKQQPGYPQKLKTSKLPYPKKLFWLFHCRDQNVFVGVFGLLNLAIIDQYSSFQRIFKVEGKHWKRLLGPVTIQHQVLKTQLCIRHSLSGEKQILVEVILFLVGLLCFNWKVKYLFSWIKATQELTKFIQEHCQQDIIWYRSYM